jgi:hypothetical protein
MFNIFCVCIETSIGFVDEEPTHIESTIHTGEYKFLSIPRIGETVIIPKFDFEFKVRAVKYTIEMLSGPIGGVTTNRITIHLVR